MKKTTTLLLALLFFLPHLSIAQVKPLSDLNTPYYCEYSPSISFDGKTLVFESNMSGRWRLYESRRMGEARWSPARYLHVINNTIDRKRFVGGCFQSYDGKFLLMSSDRKEGFGSMDILISEKKNDKWGEPVNIGQPINSIYFEGFPSLSTDGNELYFMRDFKPGAEPEKDRYFLYVSKRKDDGQWGEPQLLPEEINRYKVECPRILPNGQSLIYASQRPDSRGGFDIYRIEKTNDGSWSKPKNMELLNSTLDDNNFTVDASGEIIYFARTENGIDNLFEALFPKMEELATTLHLKGKAMDAKTNQVIAAEIKLIDADTKDTLKLFSTTEAQPEYSIFLQRGRKLIIEANSPGYSFGSEAVNLKSPTLDIEETAGKRMDLAQVFDQLVLEKEDRKIVDEAFTQTHEANGLLIGKKMDNEAKINELQDKSLKAPDSKTMKKLLKEIDKLEAENHKLDNVATPKYRMANQNFLSILNKYIGNYRVTTNEKIALLGQELEDKGEELWRLAKSERTFAGRGKSDASVSKANTTANELEDKAIGKYALAFEYYLQFINFNKSEIEKNILLIPLEKDISIVLRNVQFDFDDDQPRASSLDELNKVYQLLTDNPNLKIELSAHTDSIGSEEYNSDLSQRRAMSVVTWLIHKSISIDRLTYVGYGESKPLLPNSSIENMAINRRVEFRIVEK